MSDVLASLAAGLPHLRRGKLPKGDPVAPPLLLASVYDLPGDPAGFRQYGRFENPTWGSVEALLSHLEATPSVAFPSLPPGHGGDLGGSSACFVAATVC